MCFKLGLPYLWQNARRNTAQTDEDFKISLTKIIMKIFNGLFLFLYFLLLNYFIKIHGSVPVFESSCVWRRNNILCSISFIYSLKMSIEHLF